MQGAPFTSCLSLPSSTLKDGVRPCSISVGVLRLLENEVEKIGKRGGSLTSGLKGSEDLGLEGEPWGNLPKVEEMPCALTFSLDLI